MIYMQAESSLKHFQLYSKLYFKLLHLPAKKQNSCAFKCPKIKCCICTRVLMSQYGSTQLSLTIVKIAQGKTEPFLFFHIFFFCKSLQLPARKKQKSNLSYICCTTPARKCYYRAIYNFFQENVAFSGGPNRKSHAMTSSKIFESRDFFCDKGTVEWRSKAGVLVGAQTGFC